MYNKEKIERISELLQELQTGNTAYDDPAIAYHYDYDRVIQSLEQAKETMEQSVRCPRPKDLPKDIPWSERLSQGADDEDFNPYVYDGTMSPEDYDKMRENYERNLHSVVVYQSPDEKHCALERRDNYGIPDETTGTVGKRYALPEGISWKDDPNEYHELQHDDYPGTEVFIDNDKNGVPAIHLVHIDYKDSGKSYQDIIPMKEYMETERAQPEAVGLSESDLMVEKAAWDNFQGKLLKGHDLFMIRVFNLNEEYYSDAGPFDETQLNWWIDEVTHAVDNNPEEAAGFTIFTWDRSSKDWVKYSPDGITILTYDTGRRPDGVWEKYKQQLPPLLEKNSLQYLLSRAQQSIINETHKPSAKLRDQCIE